MDHTNFPLFYNNDFIKSIAQNEKWTISDENKIPIDIKKLITERRLVGATEMNNTSLASLSEVCSAVPNASNHAYYLDALSDKYVVLDIEPGCPENIKTKLLNMPYVYGEISMSGKGIHLAFPLPDCIYEYPNAMKKIVFKEETGSYEILLCHYVTFTRKMIIPSNCPMDDQSFVSLFREMASTQKEVIRRDVDITRFDELDIPQKNYIIELLSNQQYRKQPKDFYDVKESKCDMSKYEFGYAAFLLYKLNKLLEVTVIKNAFNEKNYDVDMLDNIKAYVLWHVTANNLEHRAKHDEIRDGLPWLLFIAREVIAKTTTTKESTDK